MAATTFFQQPPQAFLNQIDELTRLALLLGVGVVQEKINGVFPLSSVPNLSGGLNMAEVEIAVLTEQCFAAGWLAKYS